MKPIIALLTNNDDDVYCFRKELIEGLIDDGYEMLVSCPDGPKFELMRDIYSVEQTQYRRNLEELTELLQLGELLKTPTRQLSLGQRMRCELAASLMHNPRILFLDEPTIGLDAVSKLAVREFIRKLNREHGTTVILTTHDMQDIDALCHRVLLIGKGQLLLDGSTEEIRTMAGENLSTEESVADLYRRFGI